MPYVGEAGTQQLMAVESGICRAVTSGGMVATDTAADGAPRRG